MAKYDVVVIGAGPGGLVAAAVLAKNGKKVLVVEQESYLGGRAAQFRVDGYGLHFGSHLLEDAGDGLTQIMEYLGTELVHGPVGSCMPIYQGGGKWGEIRDMYAADRGELKKIIQILSAMDPGDFDKLDNIPLRTWMLQHTSHEGVIALFEYLAMLECLTQDWRDHAASDNLFMRKIHYEHKRMAGYSTWPKYGWDDVYERLANVARKYGVEFRMQSRVGQILVENGRVRGVSVESYVGNTKATPNEFPDLDVIVAEWVLSTLPIWNLPRILDESLIPDWYLDRLKLLSNDKYRIGWLGLFVATKEPVFAKDQLELCAWFDSPRTGLAGWAYNLTAQEPGISPPGVDLWNCGFTFTGARSRGWVEQTFQQVELEVQEMFPGLKGDNVLWKRRHLVWEPSFMIIQKPGLVGTNRPEQVIPGIDGLVMSGDTFKSRGIGVDRAARSAVSAVEIILGRRISGITGWRY